MSWYENLIKGDNAMNIAIIAIVVIFVLYKIYSKKDKDSGGSKPGGLVIKADGDWSGHITWAVQQLDTSKHRKYFHKYVNKIVKEEINRPKVWAHYIHRGHIIEIDTSYFAHIKNHPHKGAELLRIIIHELCHGEDPLDYDPTNDHNPVFQERNRRICRDLGVEPL